MQTVLYHCEDCGKECTTVHYGLEYVDRGLLAPQDNTWHFCGVKCMKKFLKARGLWNNDE